MVQLIGQNALVVYLQACDGSGGEKTLGVSLLVSNLPLPPIFPRMDTALSNRLVEGVVCWGEGGKKDATHFLLESHP